MWTTPAVCTWANIFHLCHNSSYNQRGKQKVFLYVATTGTGHRGHRGQRAQWQWLAVTVHVRSSSDNRCSRLLTLFFLFLHCSLLSSSFSSSFYSFLSVCCLCCVAGNNSTSLVVGIFKSKWRQRGLQPLSVSFSPTATPFGSAIKNKRDFVKHD